MLLYPLATGCGYALLATIPVVVLIGWGVYEWFDLILPEWLFLLLCIVVFIPISLFFVRLLEVIPESVEYLRIRRHPCPGCGARNWSWGSQRGFGL
jgi:hypothetical protein